jgi:Ca2+-binding EF-hand superfamily protein
LQKGKAAVVHDAKLDEEVAHWFKIMQEKMTTRFAELRRAFRTLDEDASGELDREEFKQVMNMFNLGVPDRVMDKLIDLADFDGDGSINYAEFARIFTTENVLNMKKTVQAIETDGFGNKIRYEAAQGGKKAIDKETGDNVRLRRTGPGLEKMRRAHRTIRTMLLERYGSMASAFKAIDADGSGLIRRNELRTFLRKLSKSIPDQVISGLISFVDDDGDTKTLSRAEFLKMMGEEFLDDANTEDAHKKYQTTDHLSAFRDAKKTRQP